MSDKPFITYEEQIEKLTIEKKLKIDDKIKAIAQLKRYSYFSLISGYKDPFKNPENKLYHKEVNFDDIVSLYELDELLRITFLKYILKFESNIKSLYSYAFTKEFTEHQSAYLSTNNYNYTPRNQSDINELVAKLQDGANNTSYSHIKHQKDKHGNVPLWALICTLSIGKMSALYKVSQQKIQDSISAEFSPLSSPSLSAIMKVLTKFRNVCAHNERLYNYQIKDSIPNLPLHNNLHLPQNDTEDYLVGKKDLFSVVIALKYLLPSDIYVNFIGELDSVLTEHEKKATWLKQEDLLQKMGFPKNWVDVTKTSKY